MRFPIALSQNILYEMSADSLRKTQHSSIWILVVKVRFNPLQDFKILYYKEKMWDTSVECHANCTHSCCRWSRSIQVNTHIGLGSHYTLRSHSPHSSHCSRPQTSHRDTLKQKQPAENEVSTYFLPGIQLITHTLHCTYAGVQSELSSTLPLDL